MGAGVIGVGDWTGFSATALINSGPDSGGGPGGWQRLFGVATVSLYASPEGETLHAVQPTDMKQLKFSSAALALLFLGWLVIETLWEQRHRYESVVPGWRYGHLSGAVFPSSDDIGKGTSYFMLAVKAQSKGAWYWQAPTNFSYTAFEIQTSRGPGDRPDTNSISVTLPSLAFRSVTSIGILGAVELRRFLVADDTSFEAAPTARECERFINVLKRAQSGSFPAPRHHGINDDELADSGLPPPTIFDVSFQHFDLGMGFPWVAWMWVSVWALLVWIAARKLFVPRVSKPGAGRA